MASCTVCIDPRELIPAHSASKVAYSIEPLKDPRWDEFLQRHPRASVFHSSRWLRALCRTYGYEPIVFTTTPTGEPLKNGIVLCRVASWLTGRRLVSLPFSDHCEPLVNTQEDLAVLSAALKEEFERERCDYLELRPLEPFALSPALDRILVSYAFHQLNLEPDLDVIFRNFHKSSTQRKIRRAEREGLTFLEGSTDELLNDFFRLFTLSRKRQGLAPQPKQWFRNLMECFGEALRIRVALKGQQRIAAMITLCYKDTLTYKYGCSDTRFNNLGSMHLLFWSAIQSAKASGLRLLDFGRTDADQQSLIVFKNRWGATQSVLRYSRYGLSENSAHCFDIYASKWKSRATKCVLRHVSPEILPAIGRLLYRHIG